MATPPLGGTLPAGASRTAASRTATSLAGTALAIAGLGAELVLAAMLLGGSDAPSGPAAGSALHDVVAAATPHLSGASWLGAHALAAAAAGTGIALLAARRSRTPVPRWLPTCIGACAAMPFVGALGLALALPAGIRAANARRERTPHWQTIEPTGLPFAAPASRAVPGHDRRGLAEQLRHCGDLDALYRRTLAAATMRDTASIGALGQAIAHPDDRIRLTAYQALDAKATRLNREIQRLEAGIDRLDDVPAAGPGGGEATARERSAAWLQVAANYRELLTLEEAEPVARRQLLDKARAAALRAVGARPDSRSAHFALGRLALLQGDLSVADAALERAIELGMATATVAPRLAESAFLARDFHRVRTLLASIDPAHRAYPPLRPVAERWT